MNKYGHTIIEAGMGTDVKFGEKANGDFYLASEVDARIAELESALRLCHEVLSGAAMSKQALIDALQAIKNCGLG